MSFLPTSGSASPPVLDDSLKLSRSALIGVLSSDDLTDGVSLVDVRNMVLGLALEWGYDPEYLRGLGESLGG